LRLRTGAIELSNARYERRVEEINRREREVQPLTDDQLRQQADSIRQRARNGARLDGLVIDAFALMREAARRTIGMRPFDVQLLAALALNDGKLVEMQTGEGKTLAAVLPAALRAFVGRGVHVLTYNDYLAARDAAWMGPVYRSLGLSVAHVEQGMPAAQRRVAYAADITYVTAKEAGFDFLRDEMCIEPQHRVQRGFHYAIVDEADSILIDEARVPLVIAGPADETHDDLYRLSDLVCGLHPAVDYSTDEGWRKCQLEPQRPQ
jgi:preprotein translocase subunit SecA